MKKTALFMAAVLAVATALAAGLTVLPNSVQVAQAESGDDYGYEEESGDDYGYEEESEEDLGGLPMIVALQLEEEAEEEEEEED